MIFLKFRNIICIFFKFMNNFQICELFSYALTFFEFVNNFSNLFFCYASFSKWNKSNQHKVNWSLEAPPRMLPHVRVRCGKAPPCQHPTLACKLSYPHQATTLMSSFPTGGLFPFPLINEEGRSRLILSKNRKRSTMLGRGDGKRNCSQERY